MFSDVDELPSGDVLKSVLKHELSGLVALHMPLFKWHYGCYYVGGENSGAGILGRRTDFAALRGDQLRGYATERRIYCAGWHCSNCFAPDVVRHKFYSFSHGSDSNFLDAAKTIDYIKESVRTCSHNGNTYGCTESVVGLPAAAWLQEFESLRPRPCSSA
jgi:hypothetical protein